MERSICQNRLLTPNFSPGLRGGKCLTSCANVFRGVGVISTFETRPLCGTRRVLDPDGFEMYYSSMSVDGSGLIKAFDRPSRTSSSREQVYSWTFSSVQRRKTHSGVSACRLLLSSELIFLARRHLARCPAKALTCSSGADRVRSIVNKIAISAFLRRGRSRRPATVETMIHS